MHAYSGSRVIDSILPMYSSSLVDSLNPGADPYCIVKCDRKKEKTPVIMNTLDPTFSAKVNFYISNPNSTESIVQVKTNHFATNNYYWCYIYSVCCVV